MLLVFYLLIILLPILTYFSVYSQTLRFMIDKETETQQTLTGTAMERVRSSLQYADTYTDALASITETSTYLSVSGKDPARLVDTIRSLHDTFPIFSDANGILSNPVLYSSGSHTMVDRQSAFLNLERHYGRILPAGSKDYQTWCSAYLTNKKNAVFLTDGNSDRMIYSKKIVTRLSGGRIFFSIDQNRLADLLSGSESDVPKSLILFDKEGKILYQNAHPEGAETWPESYGSEETIIGIRDASGEDQVLCITRLDDYGWILFTVIPKTYFTNHAFSVSFRIIRDTLPVLLLILLFLLLIIIYSHRSLRATVSILPTVVPVSTINPLKFFQQSVRHLSDTNRDQALQLQRSRQEMLDATISIMIYQGGNPEDPLEEKLASLGMELDAECVRAVLVTLYNPESGTLIPISEQMHTLLLEYSSLFASSLRYLKLTAPGEMLFLALGDDCETHAQELEKELTEFCWQVTQTIECGIRVYLGEECSCLNDIHHSFRSARELLISGAGSIGYLVYPDNSHRSPVYDYQGSDSRTLRTMTAAANREGVDQYLHQLYLRNSHENARSRFEYLLLYTHMLNTLMDSGYSSPLPDELTKSLPDLSVKRFFELLRECYDELCEANKRQAEDRQNNLLHEILQDIQTNLGDYGLTMTSMAMKYGLGERRLSAMIKEKTGLSFPEYLERLRIERAIELLSTSARTINEISGQVGYGSDQSFRRALKRVTGKLPTDFKRQE